MASTKEMQARAKARKQSAKNNDVMTLITPSGTKTYDSMDDYRKEVLDGRNRAAQALLDASSPANMDFSIVDEPAIRTKELTYGGRKFNVHLHTNKKKLDLIGKKYGKEFVAMFQIFNKAGSMLLPMSQETIDNAGHDYRGDTVIAKDNILNRAVAALRLNSNNPVIHDIAMHIAYEETKPDSGKSYYEGIDQLAIYRVWD
jgi:hypothetical protein